jgi:hypothetical protein
MIRHLRHTEIDKAWWDQALIRCADRSWYAQSWVLDGMSPGWEALVDDEHGAIMPLTWRRKWGVDYLFQPFGLQHLGVFAPEPSQMQTTRLMLAIPARFRYWDISLQHVAGFNTIDHDRIQERTNQVLPLDRTIEELRASYSQGHRRNLKRPDADVVFSSMTADDFADLFKRTTGTRFGASAMKGLDALRAVMAEGVLRGQCNIVCVTRKGAVLGAICFATWEGRTILLKSANTGEGIEARAMFRIIDYWIERHAGSGLLLDFAGSMTPSVARFNAGFGAQPRVYLRLVRNLLPAPLRWLKR